MSRLVVDVLAFTALTVLGLSVHGWLGAPTWLVPAGLLPMALYLKWRLPGDTPDFRVMLAFLVLMGGLFFLIEALLPQDSPWRSDARLVAFLLAVLAGKFVQKRARRGRPGRAASLS